MDKQLEGHLAHSRPHLNLPKTLRTGVRCFHSSEKGTEVHGVKWPAQITLPQWVSLLFEKSKYGFFLGGWFLKALLNLLVLDLRVDNLAACIPFQKNDFLLERSQTDEFDFPGLLNLVTLSVP